MCVSVIVPVYNSAPYLENCLLSIVRQTYGDLEIFCINDGSTDNSGEILRRFAEKDPRVHVLSQENQGVSAARNRGLELASGEWLSFVDSDDELEPDFYETLTALATEHSADIVHCGYKRICLDGTVKDVRGTGRLLVQTPAEAARCLLVGEHFSSGLWNKLYKRNLFSHIRFDTSLKINEDVLANVQVFHEAHQIAFLDVPKYHYFERESSACNRTDMQKKLRDCIDAAEKMLRMHEGDALESVCADRLLRSLTGLYRFHIMEKTPDSRAEREVIHQRICDLQGKSQSARNQWNYRFMRCFPRLYCLVYRAYDKIRTPNWDV